MSSIQVSVSSVCHFVCWTEMKWKHSAGTNHHWAHWVWITPGGVHWEHFLAIVVNTCTLIRKALCKHTMDQNKIKQGWEQTGVRRREGLGLNSNKQTRCENSHTDRLNALSGNQHTRWWWCCRQTGRPWCAGLRWSRWSAGGPAAAAAPSGLECGTGTPASERWSAATTAAAWSSSWSVLRVKRNHKIQSARCARSFCGKNISRKMPPTSWAACVVQQYGDF